LKRRGKRECSSMNLVKDKALPECYSFVGYLPSYVDIFLIPGAKVSMPMSGYLPNPASTTSKSRCNNVDSEFMI
jgi:hypothetical protein